MEIINLFFLLFIYYIIYSLEYYFKFLLFVSLSLFTSMMLHQNEIKNRIEIGKNKLLYVSLNNIIEFTFYSYNKYITFKNYIFEYKLIKYAYSKLEKVNSFYLVGRNKLLTEMGKLTYSALSPFPTTQSYRTINRTMNRPINVRQNISINETEKNKKKIVFKDEKEINNFLDSLVNKKDK